MAQVGYESLPVQPGKSSGSKSSSSAPAAPPANTKKQNQFDSLELRSHDEKFSMYDGVFKLNAKPEIAWLLSKTDQKPGVKTQTDLVMAVYQINGKTTWF